MNGFPPTVVPLVDEGLGNSSYLVDLGEGRALVVDPPCDPTRHLDMAEERGLTISHTAETPQRHTCMVISSPEAGSWPPGGPPSWRRRRLESSGPTEGWVTATRRTWVGFACGPWSDRVGRKPLITAGMILEGIALGFMAAATGFGPW